VDVGANIGLFTVLAADIVGVSGQIHSFEPSTKTFSRLQENIASNRFQNVTANQLAVSNENGSLELFVSNDGHDAWNSFAGKLAGTEGTKELVSVTTLSEYVYSRDISATLLKIDVEGWERNVILGGQEVLGEPDAPDLIVEFTESNCEAAGNSGKELFTSIEQLGFALFNIGEDLRLSPATANDDFGYKNLLATKDLDRVEKRLSR
jgi:FkbM family methyltransferase